MRIDFLIGPRAAALALVCAALAFALPPSAAAHPGVGIVVDSKGNIFYTDLKQVWRVAPDGAKSVAVPNVHTHELSIDGQDNLYGEHLWYEGEATDRWWHYFWRRSADGKIARVGPPHAPFHDEDKISLVRDAAGNSYRIPTQRNAVMRNGAVYARAKFRDPRWMTVTPDGVVYLIDDLDLVRVRPSGEVRTVLRSVTSGSLLRPDIGRRHALMGLWTDRAGNVYVADAAHGNVKRIDPAGRSRVVIAESTLPWAPSGGVFARNGDLWLLEYSVTGAARIRRAAAHR